MIPFFHPYLLDKKTEIMGGGQAPKSEFGCVGKKIDFAVFFLNESGPAINATGPSWQPETH